MSNFGYIAIFCLLTLFFLNSNGYAESQSFTKEYTYQASEQDSKVTCRTHAIAQVKRLLLEELGTYIESHSEVVNLQLTRDEIVSVSLGIVRSEIIDESWDGLKYWIKANLTADPDEVLQSIKESMKTPTNESMKTPTKETPHLIIRNKEYRISFHSADIKPGAYSKDDSNPAPDAYVVVKNGQGIPLFKSSDVFVRQNNTGILLANRNNYTPNFSGVGFNHTFSNGCISVYLMDWDGCEGFMCGSSSADDGIGSDFKICVGDKIDNRWSKASGWQMDVKILPAE